MDWGFLPRMFFWGLFVPMVVALAAIAGGLYLLGAAL